MFPEYTHTYSLSKNCQNNTRTKNKKCVSVTRMNCNVRFVLTESICNQSCLEEAMLLRLLIVRIFFLSLC